MLFKIGGRWILLFKKIIIWKFFKFLLEILVLYLLWILIYISVVELISDFLLSGRILKWEKSFGEFLESYFCKLFLWN